MPQFWCPKDHFWNVTDEQLVPEEAPSCPACEQQGVALPKENERSIPPTIGDRYEILCELGRGGMGVVYLVWTHGLKRRERRVALKTVLPGKDAGDLRMREDALAAMKLDHKNIVKVYNAWQHQGRIYVEMEHLTGGTLAEKHRARPQDPKYAADVIEQLARAMHHAHTQGVIHRDLKPDNVLFAQNGALKITDFGLAKRVDASVPSSTGHVLGTPSYMSPEQWKGDSTLDPRTDIYALGVMLYEMLTGLLPFSAPDPPALVILVLNEEPRQPRKLKHDVPPALQTICLKCLEKKPAARYATALELAQDLERYRNSQPIQAKPASPGQRAGKWCRRHPVWTAVIAAASVLLVVAGSLSAGLIVQNGDLGKANTNLNTALDDVKDKNTKLGNANSEIADKNTKLEQANGEITDKNTKLEQANSDIVRQLAHVTANDGLRRINEGNPVAALPYLAKGLRILEQNKVRDENLEDLLRARFAMVLQQCLRPTRIWSLEKGVSHTEFNPDGRRVLTVTQDGAVRVLDVAGDKPLMEWLPRKGEAPFTCAAFSPDGKAVVTGADDGNARVWNASTGEPVTKPLALRERVLHVAFSPNGQFILAAGGSRFGQPRVQHTPPVTIPGAGPGSTITIPGSAIVQPPEGLAQVWDSTTGQEVKTLPVAGWVNHASFSPDSLRVVTASASMDGLHQVRVWEILPVDVGLIAFGSLGPVQLLPSLYLKDLRETPALMGPASQVNRACFSPDGRWVISASGQPSKEVIHAWHNEAQIWQATTGQRRGLPLRHDQTVTLTSFSSDGSRVVTGSDDFTARIWYADTSEPLSPPLVHQGPVTAATFSSDGRLLLTASLDGTARFWDGRTGDPIIPPLPHGSPVQSACLSADGKYLTTACEDGLVRVWDLNTVLRRLPSFQHNAPVTYAAFGSNGRLVTVTGGLVVETTSGVVIPTQWASIRNTDVWVWDQATGKKAREPQRHHAATHEGFLNPAGDRVLTVAQNVPPLGIWHLSTGEFRSLTTLRKAPVFGAAFHTDGRCLLITGTADAHVENSDRRVSVIDAESGKPVAGPCEHDALVRHAVLSHDGSRLVTVTGPGIGEKQPKPNGWAVRVWDTGTSKMVKEPWTQDSPVYRIHVSARGRSLVILSPAEARLLRVDTGQRVTLGQAGTVLHVAFSPDERLVVTAGDDGTARVWDAETGKAISPLLEHRGPVNFAAFTPDSRLVVTCSHDKTARVWQANTGEPISPWLHHCGEVVHVSFSQDGSKMVTASYDGTARVWELAAEKRALEDLARLAEMLASHQLDAKGSLTALSPRAVVDTWKKCRAAYPVD